MSEDMSAPLSVVVSALIGIGAYHLIMFTFAGSGDGSEGGAASAHPGAAALAMTDNDEAITQLWMALILLLLGFLLAAAWVCLSGHRPRSRVKAPYSIGRFQLLTLRLNSLHDWLIMNLPNARSLAERAAAESK